MEEIKTQNHKFIVSEDGEVTSRPATAEEIDAGRKKLQLSSDPNDWGLRSCYECNGAHGHLMREGVTINCFGCGRWFVDGVDIMDYTPPPTTTNSENK